MVPAELRELETKIGRVADELDGVVEDLREIARGIHPAILSEGGLGPALRTLARRAAIVVELDVAAIAGARSRSRWRRITSSPRPSRTRPGTRTRR